MKVYYTEHVQGYNVPIDQLFADANLAINKLARKGYDLHSVTPVNRSGSVVALMIIAFKETP